MARPKTHSEHIIPIHAPSLSLSFPGSLPNRLAELNITCTRPMNKQGQGQAVLKHAASFRRQKPWVIHELCLRKRKEQGKSVTVYLQLAHKVCSNTTRLVKGGRAKHTRPCPCSCLLALCQADKTLASSLRSLVLLHTRAKGEKVAGNESVVLFLAIQDSNMSRELCQQAWWGHMTGRRICISAIMSLADMISDQYGATSEAQ